MDEPLVSVVIPFYTNKKWLVEAIESVLSQAYKNTEILVINDGSPENLDDLRKNYKNRINIIDKENGGPSSARNLGIKKSSGKYIAFLDSDDLWMPDKLAEQIKYMEKTNSVWSQHSYEMFWENSNKTKIVNTQKYTGDVYKDCFISFKVQTSCVVVLKQILEDKNIFFPLDKRFGQDIDFFRQIAKDYSLDYVDGVFSKFRIRGTNAGFSAKVQIEYRASTWEEIKKDLYLQKKFPQRILYAYKMTSIFSKVINKKNINNEKVIEFISKILYFLPYIFFKSYGRKRI